MLLNLYIFSCRVNIIFISVVLGNLVSFADEKNNDVKYANKEQAQKKETKDGEKDNKLGKLKVFEDRIEDAGMDINEMTMQELFEIMREKQENKGE